MLLDTVFVCDHALRRWRERVSCFASSPSMEVILALRAARKMDPTEPLPPEVYRQHGFHYYTNDDWRVLFVVEPIDQNSSRIVTVVNLEAPKNPIFPKTKKHRMKTMISGTIMGGIS